MQKLNENDKNVLLDELLGEGETYKCKLWGVLMASDKDYLAIGALSTLAGSGAAALGALNNSYGYLGLTEERCNLVVIDNFNVSKVLNSISIPLKEIKKVKIKGGLIPGRKVVLLDFGDSTLKISIMTSSAFTDIQNQKENAEKFFELVSNIS